MFVALDNAVEKTAASATGGVAAALAGSALLCHVEHAKRNAEKEKKKWSDNVHQLHLGTPILISWVVR